MATTLKVHRYQGEEDMSVFEDRKPVITITTTDFDLLLLSGVQEKVMETFNENMDPEGLNYNPYVMSHKVMDGPGYIIVILYHGGHDTGDGGIVGDEGTEFVIFLS